MEHVNAEILRAIADGKKVQYRDTTSVESWARNGPWKDFDVKSIEACFNWCSQAAAELRRQHARIADLEAQLSAIGAGGVEPLRKREASAAAPAVLPEPEAWLATFRPKGILSSHSIAGTNLEELKRSVPSDSKFKPLYAQPILTIVGMSTTVQTEQGGTQQ